MQQRCLIVDDNGRFLAVLRRVLEAEGFDVVGTASTVDEALQRVADLRPGLALVDVELGQESGVDLARRLAERPGGDRPTVILMSAGRPQDYAELVVGNPVLGFLPKDQISGAAIADLIRTCPRPLR